MTTHGYGLLSPDSPADVASEVEVGEAACSPFGSERSDFSPQDAQPELIDSQLQLLWRISVEPEFLRSKASRRELWRILLPLLGLGLGLLNLLAGAGLAQLHDLLSLSGAHESAHGLVYRQVSCYSDAAMLILMLLASRLPAGSLWSDVLIMIIMGAYGVTCGFLEVPEAMLQLKTTVNLCADFYRVLVVLAFVSSGVHMCAIGGFLLISASSLPMLGTAHELPRLVAGLVAFILAGVAYLQPLNMFQELQKAAPKERTPSVASVGIQIDSDAMEPESPTTKAQAAPVADFELVIPEGMRNLTAAAKAAQRARLARLKEAQEKEVKDEQPVSPLSPSMEKAEYEDEKEIEAQFSLMTDQSAQSAQSASFTPVSFQASSNTRATSSLRYSHSSRGSRLSRLSPWSNSSDPEQAQAFLKLGRPRPTAESGVQTETTSLSLTLCRRCMRPPSLPLSVTAGTFAPVGSGRSSRTSDRGASQRSSARSVRSAMRVLGQLTRRSKGNNSEYNAEHYDDASPVVSSFKITQMLSVQLSLQWAMKHWNMPRIVGSCCPWHTAVLVARKALEDLDSNACDPLWSSLTGWQCTECTCLNHIEVHRCDMCLESKPSSSSGNSSEQPSTFGNTSLDIQSLPSSTQQSSMRMSMIYPGSEADGENVRPVWSGSSAFSRRGTSSTSPGALQTAGVRTEEVVPADRHA